MYEYSKALIVINCDESEDNYREFVLDIPKAFHDYP